MSFPTGLEPPPVADPPRDEGDAEPATQRLTGDQAAAPGPAAGAQTGEPRDRTATRIALALAAAIVLTALTAKGGASLSWNTLVFIVLTLAGATIAAAAVLTAPTPARRWGAAALLTLAALTAWTAISVVWSVAPDRSWAEANRSIAYLAVFAGGLGAARLWPRRSGAVVAGVLIAAIAISAIAIAFKAYPVVFNSTESLARMREPLDYWNALGLLAALAIPACLWLGARRDAPPAQRALAYPLMGLATIVVALSYSRGALIALAAGILFWLALTPLRLRGIVVALVGGAGGLAVSLWAFSQDALSKDRAPLAQRVDTGGDFAMFCVLMAVVLFGIGLALNRYGDRRPLTERRRRQVGLGVAGAVLAVVVAGGVALSVTGGGPGARAERAWDNFFSTSKSSTTYGPERLKSIGTRRGSYWDEAAEVWSAHPALGTGGGGYAVARKRYRDEPTDVQRAHGYVPQTAADLGAIGVVLSLLFVVALGFAAAATLGRSPDPHPRRLARLPAALGRSPNPDPRRLAGLPAALAGVPKALAALPAALTQVPKALAALPDRMTPRRPVDGDRVAILSLLAILVTFAVHSLIDWTWMVPAIGITAVAIAGYVAGRGPLGVPGPPSTRPVGARMSTAALLAAIALAGSWAIWQPLRAERAGDAALAALGEGRPPDAAVQAQAAHERNPLALRPLFDLSTVLDAAGRKAEAQKALEDAVRLQPANPDSWVQLATYQLNVLNQPSVAFQSARAALFLDPKSPAVQSLFLDAYRKLPRRPVQPGKKTPNRNPVLDELSKLGK